MLQLYYIISGGIATLGEDGKVPQEQLPQTPLVKRTITLPDGWAGEEAPFTQNYTVEGMTADAVVWVDIAQTATAEQFEAYVSAKIANGGQTDNQVAFKAFGENPAMPIPVDIAFLKE